MLAKILVLAVTVSTILLGDVLAESPCNDTSRKSQLGGELPCLLYAAEQGNAHAQHSLGFAYAEGRCCPRDIQEAYVWWAVAAMNGVEAARGNLAVMRKQMTSAEFELAQTAAMERFLRLSY